jgi:D-glycero-beta-D-manno-heptose 1-phosphate adenylyltransferase
MSFHDRLKDKVVDAVNGSRIVTGLKLKGRKIVFTNGCFDILHAGHVDYLTKARDMGNFLVLGLNTDSSVKQLNKGLNRPVNNQDARCAVLAALASVDLIVLFDEETPYELIKTIQPDVLVKGSDYKPEDIVGKDIVEANGGKVVTVALLQGYSTTAVISKIKGE